MPWWDTSTCRWPRRADNTATRVAVVGTLRSLVHLLESIKNQALADEVLQFGVLPDPDGPVTGVTGLVHGVLGAAGTLAAQLARWAGATVAGYQGTRPDRAYAWSVPEKLGHGQVELRKLNTLLAVLSTSPPAAVVVNSAQCRPSSSGTQVSGSAIGSAT
jgi:hypothetical protein